MAVNRYIQNYPSQERITNEYLVMEDIIVESIQMMGHNIYYVPRESFDEGDMVFGEYSKSSFNSAYLIEAYLSNVTGHEGQGDFFSKFGLEIRDTDTFVLSRRAFLNTLPGETRMRPREGDLLYVPVLHKLYEIKFVEQELMFHSLGKRLPFVYELRCEAFRSSNEPMNTGVPEIDQVASENNYTMELLVTPASGITVDYIMGETVFQSSNDNINGTITSQATVKEWFSANGSLLIYNITGEFSNTSNLIGASSSAKWKLADVDGMTNYSYYNLNDNMTVDTDAGLILDLSQNNPFGNP